MKRREEFPLFARYLDGLTQGEFPSLAHIETLLLDKDSFSSAEIRQFREAEEAMAKHHLWSREMAVKEGDKFIETHQAFLDQYMAENRGKEPQEPSFSFEINQKVGHNEQILRGHLIFCNRHTKV